jgi:hypothetical protein
MRTVLGNIHGSEEMNAVPHGDAKFIFSVMLLDVKVRSIGLVLRGKAGDKHK